MKIGGATVNQIPFDWKNNSENIIQAIEEAKRQEIKILCLPELCITGYGCEDMFLSEWLSERAKQEVLKFVNYTGNITISVGLPIRLGDITYNAACVISNKKILGITLKQNLANDGVHYEPRWFTPWQPGKVVEVHIGNEIVQAGDVVYHVNGITFGFEICEDAWRKTRRPGYRLAERGVQLILNPSASHFAMGKSLLRELEVVTDGSRLFNCTYVFTNLLGNEAGRMIYDGDIIIAQKGKLLAVNERFSFKSFNVLSVNVDFEHPEKSETLALADSKDVKVELGHALALALYDYLRKSRAKGYVLSLSGGADSSICAVFVAEMVQRGIKELGADQFTKVLGLEKPINHWTDGVAQILTCAYQGTKNSSATTLHAAKRLADSIGAQFYAWNIDEEVTSYTQKIERAMGRELTWERDDVTLQNIQARSRSPIIWMLANINRSVLLTTSNRSEGDVGYATMDGDTSGSLAPIAGLSKVFILQWLRWAEKELGYIGLNPVNNLQPTAELRPLERNQTDEADLMPYPVLAQIERHAIFHRKPPVQVFEALKDQHDPELLKGYIKKFFRLWTINQWKRERIAPSFHLDDLNVDPRTWCRFPILSSGFSEELEKLDEC